jgi:hypothetical protein
VKKKGVLARHQVSRAKKKKQKRADQTDTEKDDANQKRRDAYANKKRRKALYKFSCSSPERSAGRQSKLYTQWVSLAQSLEQSLAQGV